MLDSIFRINTKIYLMEVGVGLTAAIALAANCQAVGINGFPPGEEPISGPSTGLSTSAWKQTGVCAASAVQISPNWVLSTNHARCHKGSTFTRYDGQHEVIDLDTSTQLYEHDLFLSRLANPLPFAGSFVPLAYDIQNIDSATADCRQADILMAGWGIVVTRDNFGNLSITGPSKLQLGWAPPLSTYPIPEADFSRFLFSDVKSIRPDPRLNYVDDIGKGTPGDSGGGVFLLSSSIPEGALIGLMATSDYGAASASKFDSSVRDQINQVLQDSTLNPNGDRVNWVEGSQLLGTTGLPMPPRYTSVGGKLGTTGIPKWGFESTTQIGNLQLNIPAQINCNNGSPYPYGSSGVPGSYRIRLVPEDASPDYAPITIDVNGFPNATQALINNINPGRWRMTVSARQHSEVTMRQEESRALGVIGFTMPDALPHALKALNVGFQKVQSGGQYYYSAHLQATPADDGPAPDGITWFHYAMNNNEKALYRTSKTYDVDLDGNVAESYINTISNSPEYDNGLVPQEGAAIIYSKFLVPGKTFQIIARPYIGVGNGPATILNFTVPQDIQ